MNHTENAKILTLTLPIMSKLRTRGHILELLSKTHGAKIYTPNAQMALGCAKSRTLTEVFDRAEFLIPDGIGLILASKMLKTPIPERITGIDTAQTVLKYAEKRGLSVALLGAEPHVAERAKKKLEKRFPRLNIVYTHHGYFKKYGKENSEIIKELRKAEPDVLFVCFGFPLQELWIDKNAKSIPSLRLCMGLGGALDVFSEKVKRAPRPVQILGLEWLWRTLGDKRRYGNFRDIIDFSLLVIAQKHKNQK